jgi:hypothetical protein
MVESNGLLPIVMGIGLAVLSGGTLAAARGRGEQSQWRDPLFVFAALLVGVPIFGAALYELGWSIERGHKLNPAEARAENWLVVALAVLLMLMAGRAAWTTYFNSPSSPPWERGHLDRLPQLLGFVMASLVVVLLGTGVAVLIAFTEAKASNPIDMIVVTLTITLGIAYVLLRLMSGGNPSPRAFELSRRQQMKTLMNAEAGSGSWISVQVRAVGDLEPSLALTATTWVTLEGMYWRAHDASALARYHSWAANHATAPTPALHAQMVTVFAGRWPESMRGLRIIPLTSRRLWRMHAYRDAWRAHLATGPSTADASTRELAAGLVHIEYEQLREAGLVLMRIRQ